MFSTRPLSTAAAQAPLLTALAIAILLTACSSTTQPSPTQSPSPSLDTLDIAPTAAPPQQAQADEPSPTPEPTPVPPPPEAAAPPAENRANCSAIRGTEYRSAEERDWFVATCARLPGGMFTTGPPPAAAASPSGGQSPMGDRLVIPAAGVNTEVWRVTVPASGVMPDPAGYFNALWYDFRALPGFGGYLDSGNLVLAGHVDCGKCYNGGPGTAIFWTVRNLRPGDAAQYRSADGRVVNYVVTSSHTVTGETSGLNIVSAQAADMTLITCTGSFSGGEYSLRHVVTLRKA